VSGLRSGAVGWRDVAQSPAGVWFR